MTATAHKTVPGRTHSRALHRTLEPHEHGLLILQLALVLAPELHVLPLASCGLTGVLLLWRTLMWVRGARPPRTWVLGAAGLLVIVLTVSILWRSGGSIGRDMSVSLLSAFVVLKLMETRTVAHAILVTQLCIYLLLSYFLFTQVAWLALYAFAITAWLLRNWLVFAHPEARTRTSPWQTLGKLALTGLPCAIVLFLLFPRLDQPLWRLPPSTDTSTTGMSDSMSPGSIGRLTRSTKIAFQVNFEGEVPPRSMLYWRALVLWQFDGHAWHPGPQRDSLAGPTQPATPAMRRRAASIPYTVTLEPHRQRWLFMLDQGIDITQGPASRVSADGVFTSSAPVDERLRYQARSRLPAARADVPELDPATRRLALALPPGNPRARALGEQWAARHADPAARVRAALAMFAGPPFAYTLTPPRTGLEQIDDFVFDTRKGFCEHYAGSMVFLMRAAGVPARVVVGYLGGEWNPLGGHHIVRQADAHAWTEVWLEKQGWVRVDPTSAVSPLRIEQGLEGALPDEADALTSLRAPGWLRQLRWTLNGVSHNWNQWVLNYDRAQQIRLMQGLNLDANDVRLLVAGMLAILLLGGWLALRRPQEQVDPVQRLYLGFCASLARHGCVRRPDEGPLDYAARAASAFPQAAKEVDTIVRHYVALRYGPESGHATTTGEGLQQMRAAVQRLRRIRLPRP